jgi:hypothetical protein
MTFNTVAAAKGLNRIERHPETWDQAVWCGCFAGQVVRAEGHRIDINNKVITAGGEDIGFVWNVATEILFGREDFLYCKDARVMFFSLNTLERLKELVTEHISRAVEKELGSLHSLDEVSA